MIGACFVPWHRAFKPTDVAFLPHPLFDFYPPLNCGSQFSTWGSKYVFRYTENRSKVVQVVLLLVLIITDFLGLEFNFLSLFAFRVHWPRIKPVVTGFHWSTHTGSLEPGHGLDLAPFFQVHNIHLSLSFIILPTSLLQSFQLFFVFRSLNI